MMQTITKTNTLLMLFICLLGVSSHTMMRRGPQTIIRKSAQRQLNMQHPIAAEWFTTPLAKIAIGPVGGLAGSTYGGACGFVCGAFCTLPAGVLMNTHPFELASEMIQMGMYYATIAGALAGSVMAGGPLGLASCAATTAAIKMYLHKDENQSLH